MSTGFAGQAAVVAGGTGGLGRAVSLAFLDERRDRRRDVTDDHQVHQFVEGIVAQHGRLDTLVNTVGGYVGGAKLWDLDPKDFERMLAMNLRSGYALSRAVVPVMLKQEGGSIVNIAAKAGIDHPAGAAAYAASKAAALAMMDSLAAELAGTCVRVNSVLPSIIDTSAIRKAMPKAEFAKWPKPEECRARDLVPVRCRCQSHPRRFDACLRESVKFGHLADCEQRVRVRY